MPTKEIDQKRKFTKGLPLVAVFKKGDADGNDLEHFRMTTLDNFEFIYPFLYKEFGREATSISPIYLIGDTPNDALTYWMEEHDERTEQLTKRCDQEFMAKWFNKTEGYYSSEPKRCESATCHCVRRARLHFRLPVIRKASGILGRYLATSRSRTDIAEMLAYLDSVYQLYVRGYGYDLDDIPFTLSREPRIISIPDGEGDYEEITSHLLQLKVVSSFARTAKPQKTHRYLPNTAEHDMAYLSHLETLFASHIPSLTVESFAAHYGLSPQGLVANYPQLNQVKTKVMEWLIETGTAVYITNILCLKHRKQFKYRLETGFDPVIIYGRKPFKDLNYDVSSWRGLGVRTHLEPAAPIVIGKTRTLKYKLLRVVPIAEPQ